LLNEGVDIPAINVVLFLRPTDSPTLFLQQLGRGLRLSPGAEVLTVLDFVGQHRASWIPLNAIHQPTGVGREVVVGDQRIRPPDGCEVVLDRKTQEILRKVQRFSSRREACSEAYLRLRDQLGRPVMPIDLDSREDVPPFSDFRTAYGDWLGAQARHGDAPAWAEGLGSDAPARRFLARVEADWQAQRVGVYALCWGLCARPDDPAAGYEGFFERYPHLRVEYAPLGRDKTWASLAKKLDGLLEGQSLAPGIREVIGEDLLAQVDARLLLTVQRDYRTRHAGTLRTPDQLVRGAGYTRPGLVNHFGEQFDPARHSQGFLWFDERKHGVIVLKLDTSGAVESRQYDNHIRPDGRLLWTSQPKMAPDNNAGRPVVRHVEEGRTLHLFVQAGSHGRAVYQGPVQVVEFEGGGPMRVVLERVDGAAVRVE
jgi:hypothetical protein